MPTLAELQLHLADDGNYREPRWFTAWPVERKGLEECTLPDGVCGSGGRGWAPFGCGVVVSDDAVSIGAETCEELFTPLSPHIALSLDGVDIVGNGSGSHHELRKLHTRVDLIRSATSKGGGAYLYANQQGCDGGRLYYDGCAMVACNGAVVAQGTQFSVSSCEVVCAVVDVDAIRSYRMAIASRSVQARSQPMTPRVKAAGLRMVAPGLSRMAPTAPLPDPEDAAPSASAAACGAACSSSASIGGVSSSPAPSAGLLLRLGRRGRGGVLYMRAEEEIALGPACWLWDQLRSSGARGFFLPLSGGADSAATAAIAGVMCELLCDAIAGGDEEVAAEVRRVTGHASDSGWVPASPQELAGLVLHTAYMGSANSTAATRERAGRLAAELGCWHTTLLIDTVVAALLAVLAVLMGGRTPRFLSRGGSWAEDVALQNLQARVRMVLSYALGQLLPWYRGLAGGDGGFLLVLGSANVDEALRGYMTKYDCSSADLNPIGGIAKLDLRRFLCWAGGADGFGWGSLVEIAAAAPTAELRPLADPEPTASGESKPEGASAAAAEHSQTDEEDMGMSYAELREFGRLRKLQRCGPLSMFRVLLAKWPHLSPGDVATKVKRFWHYHTATRHKMTVLTPAYHAEGYSPDDNRFDLRPFAYRSLATQYHAIDEAAAAMEAAEPASE